MLRWSLYSLSQVSEYWVADLDLKTRDKVIIEKGGLLTDKHVCCTQSVVRAVPTYTGTAVHRSCTAHVPLPLCLSAVASSLKVSGLNH